MGLGPMAISRAPLRRLRAASSIWGDKDLSIIATISVYRFHPDTRGALPDRWQCGCSQLCSATLVASRASDFRHFQFVRSPKH
jgi:hypothetical protein